MCSIRIYRSIVSGMPGMSSSIMQHMYHFGRRRWIGFPPSPIIHLIKSIHRPLRMLNTACLAPPTWQHCGGTTVGILHACTPEADGGWNLLMTYACQCQPQLTGCITCCRSVLCLYAYGWGGKNLLCDRTIYIFFHPEYMAQKYEYTVCIFPL